LRDDYGGLGQALAQNQYFVSDTNYGWGPDAIGDRTDIVNWPEWFRSSQTETILSAVYSESGQNSSYTRTFGDPGGENQIVIFKSCFPNSQIEGSPNDAAASGDGLTVSNAKFIYNDLLNYFRTRPDKLFIVITAPPVQDSTYAENARAFSTWLAQDWLRENNYPYSNVAVFDFHNVLTHRDNHHRYQDGQIEYEVSHGDGTSAYATGRDDDHPNEAGSRKATEEFLPLLNIFYNRWKAEAGTVETSATPTKESAVEAATAVPEPTQESASGLSATVMIDDFETGVPPLSTGWTANWDVATTTSIQCTVEGGTIHAGTAALHAAFTVQAGSWSICALEYENIRNVTDAAGLSFYVHAATAGSPLDVLVYGGSPEEKTTYEKTLETTQTMVDDWELIHIPWNELLRVDWEADAGTPFDPARFTGLGFGFNASSEEDASGEIWIDDISLLGVETILALETSKQPTFEADSGEEQAQPTETATEPAGRRKTGPCVGSIAVGFLAAAVAFWHKKKR